MLFLTLAAALYVIAFQKDVTQTLSPDLKTKKPFPKSSLRDCYQLTPFYTPNNVALKTDNRSENSPQWYEKKEDENLLCHHPSLREHNI